MKNLFIIGLALLLSNGLLAQSAATEAKVIAEKSEVMWTGKKVTGEHSGVISIKEGMLKMDDAGALSGGEIIIDMASIQCTDLEGESKGKLEGHLASEDFFGIEKHPTAKLVISRVKPMENNVYHLLGAVTIKDITQPVEFDATIGDGVATADIKINRTKFDIKYGSGSFFDDLGDKAIYDDFDLKVKLAY